MTIKFIVQPSDGVAPAPNSSSISVEAVYAKTVSVVEGETNDPVSQAVRITLDAGMKGTAVLDNPASPQVLANVLAVDGSLIFSRTVNADNAGNATLSLTKAEVDFCANRAQAIPSDTVPLISTRAVQLVLSSDTRVDYTRSSVIVSVVQNQAAISGNATASTRWRLPPATRGNLSGCRGC